MAACNNKNNTSDVVQVDSPNVQYTKECIESTIDYPINYALTEKDTIVVIKFTLTIYNINNFCTRNKFYSLPKIRVIKFRALYGPMRKSGYLPSVSSSHNVFHSLKFFFFYNFIIIFINFFLLK